MSGLINNFDENLSLSIIPINNDFPTIYLYLLWNSNIDDEFKIQGLFGKDSTYELTPIDRFRAENKSETIVYRLEYKILTSNEEYGNLMTKYQLRMSTKTNYDDIKQRTINLNIPYQFLFDVHFQKKKGSAVEFWNQLCLYTYFLIKNKFYENFDSFIHQFLDELNSNGSRKLTQHQFIMFFYSAYTYLPQINFYLKTDKNVIKIFLRMLGILPIDKDNFKIDNTSLSSLASELYDYIKMHLDDLLKTTDYKEWLEFVQGLIIFMSAQMLGTQTIFNTFSLLDQMINYQDKQQLIGNSLVKRIVELQMPIKNNNWVNLFPLVTDRHLLHNCLDLVTTLDDYLIALQYIIRNNSINEQMQMELTKNFDKLINRGDFLLSLENILNLLTHLHPRYKSSTYSSTKDMEIFQLIIKSSSSLRYKITTCLDNLDVNKVPLESLCELFQLDHFVSIILIDKTKYLSKLITNHQNRNREFYTTWFICFLCDKYYQSDNADQQHFQQLLNLWLNYIQKDRDMLPQIISKLDLLIEHLRNCLKITPALSHNSLLYAIYEQRLSVISDNNDNRLIQFVDDMLAICFQQNITYQIIIDICTKVTNKTFLHCYEKKFIEDLLVNNGNRLKLMDDTNNPLYHLLELSKIVDPSSHPLLSNLIIACSKLIKLNNEEIRYEAFVHPTKKTCTYAVLFVQYLNDYDLYKGTLNQLDTLWNRWTHTGLTISDINIWKSYNSDEQKAFHDIWEYVQKHFNKRESIDITFTKTELEYKEKNYIREAMISVLSVYCDKANDYTNAISSLRDMLHEFDEKPIRSVELPKDLKDMKSMALKLYPFSLSQVWIHYYHRSFLKIEKSRSQSNSLSKALQNSNSFDSDSEDDVLTSSISNQIKLNVRSNSLITYVKPTKNNLTLIDILNNTNKVFEEFHNHLKHICINWREETIHEWIELFSDIQNINSELEILRSNLHLEISTELIDILNLWKQRDFIYHVCQGCLNLITQLGIPVKQDDLNVLETLVQLDETILGGRCSFVYQQYLNQYVLRYSSDALIIWSQFSIANELIDFINSMPSTDFDNLLENINDWDEKLVSAKTVIDYSTLKYYLQQVYKFIDQLKKDKHQYLLPNILNCFDKIDINNQFGNVQEFFAICSGELSSMRQSHSELTDKELSKRRQIINIMEDSKITFIQLVKFDVCISPQDVNFFDLNELRDRARLIGYSFSNKMKKDDEHQMKIFDLFVKFVDIIEKMLNTLTSLYIAGHPIISEIIMIKRVFCCEENQFGELIKFNEELQEIFVSWERTLWEKYIIYPELTYFSCEQFDMIERFIYNKSGCDEEEYGYHLLKYSGLEPNLIRQLDLLKEKRYTAEDRLENIGEILSRQRDLTRPLSQENWMNKKIFTIETTDNEILRAILSLYHRFKSLPKVNHLFYCTNQTNWMEMRGFMYRCIYSQQFHQLIRPELLSISLQDKMIQLIRQIAEDEPQHLFRLGIITTIPIGNLQLIDGLKSLQIVHTIHEQDLMNNAEFGATISNLMKKCTIVTSRISGLGKSHTIRDACSKTNKEYIKFPINGDIQPDLIAKRLLKEARKFQQGAIHFDIGIIDNYRQINDLINCLVLFRCFSFGQIAISIPVETPIYIELDCSSHSNLLEHVVIFQHIPSIYIDHIDWRKLIITEPARLVASYLKSIKDKTCTKKDVTPINMQVNECIKLFQEYFFNDKLNDYITWTKLFIYISVFYKLFLGFSNCCYFQIKHLRTSELRESRMDILKTFLKSADQFISISIEATRKQQRTTNSTDTLQQQELSNVIIRWDQIQPFTLIVSSTNVPIFVYKKDENVPESLKKYFYLYNREFDTKQLAQQKVNSLKESDKKFFPDYKQLKHEELFERLTNLSMKYFNKAICTKCFRQYDYETFICEKCLDTNDLLERPYPSLNFEDIQAFQKRIAKVIESEYVITADNYIKMLLVFLRVQSSVPVLIMGETGCGKTALINCLCRKILDDDLHVFRLHAGVTDEKLIEEMNELIIQANNLSPEKRLWIFFDEFNTISNISLLKEIICERSILGKSLPKNMVFLGTCNPHRKVSDKSIFKENIGLEKDIYKTIKLMHHRQTLFYKVTQIPETMLEYIWDYGHLDQITEKTYIEATLKTCEGLSNDIQWFETIIELISESHVYLREIEDISSVSLRDVARFCRLYKWLNQYLINIDDNSSLIQRASLIALLLCYYFRLDSKEKKQRYLERLVKRANLKMNRSKLFTVKYLEKVLEKEERRLINQMQLPNDMALNRALKENIFVLFSCIINRIPVFICGKPGASKTSAVQILMNNLKGLRSDNIFFRKLPELVPVTFQGSQNCTSKSIEQVFQRAEKYMKIETNSVLLPVIIFDEIGLAELSIYNPLKVLHEQLEIEQCKFGFVGISNWRLDAAKMNRALYVACIDPDDEDLESTGKVLSKLHFASNQSVEFDQNIIRGLSQAYSDLQKRMNKEHKHENYFGLRDYYSLIKGIVYNCQKYPQRSQYEIIYQQLIINFGGINNGYELMWEQFCTCIDRFDLIHEFTIPSPKQLIQQGLTNRNSRYLMLIVDRESTIDHVERYITTNPILNGSVKTLVGSHFEGDFISNGIYTESYSTRVLMEIILHAETPITLVMRRMNHLYDNLYDLFNQNFAITGRKKYCRIALSSIYNPRCFVNDNFYCVILLNAKDIDISDPPFLNRFEKHYIQIDKLIQPRQLSLTSQLRAWLLNLPLPTFSKHFPLLKHLIIPYNPDYICDLVIDLCQDNDLTDEMILKSCREKLIRACSFDFPLVLSLDKNNSLIEEYYHIHNQLMNISQLITLTIEQSLLTKRIIYTYTNIYDTIDYEHCVNNIREIKLSNIKTELELITLLKNSNENNFLIIRIDYHSEKQHILSLKYNLINHLNELKTFHLWIIYHIQRNKLNQIENDVLFNGWDIVMIDDLNNKQKFIPKDILINPSYEYFIDKYQFKFIDIFFQEFIHRTLAKFRYENEQRYNDLFAILNSEEDQFFYRIFRETVQHFIKTVSNPDETRFKDWRYDLISNNYITITSQSFDEALQSIMISFYDSYFQLLFHHFESFNLFDSYFYLQTNKSTDLKNFWLNCYKLSLNTIDNSIMNVNCIEICLVNDLQIPYSIKEKNILPQIRDNVQEKLEESVEDLDENDLQLIIMDLLKEKSSYGETLIDRILNNNELLDLYYHDQLILFHMENKFQFSTKFTLKLMRTDTKRSTMNRLIQLIAYPEELSGILRIFEDGFKLLDENILLECMNKQLISVDTVQRVSNSFYSIIVNNEKFHLILPNTLEINEEFEFDPLGDPFIEITIMNLIEFILCPERINTIENIEQITAIFSSITQSVLKLTQRVIKLTEYNVINLEKLRSFMSLLRCIKTLNPSKALEIFQKCCKDDKFDASFQACNHIHQFIENLEKYIMRQQGSVGDRTSIKSTLLKLEIEFLKNWLVDHNNQYPSILYLINQTENNLWRYSAKIFSYIVGKLDLLKNIESTYEQTQEEFDEINQLEEHLNSLAKSHYKIHRLFVNRIHLDLILRFPINKQHSTKEYLNRYYDHFEKSVQCITLMVSSKEYNHVKLILILSWLKYYTQLYSFLLVNNIKFAHSDQIDQYLTNNKSLFCSTLKLFIFKQILNLSKIDLNTFENDLKYRNITWLNEFFEKINEEKSQNHRNIILPIPLLEIQDEYLEINKILTDFPDENSFDNLIFHCSRNQYLSYCFYLWFVKHYIQYSYKNFQSNNFYRDLFQKDLSDQSKTFLQPIGIHFLHMLCTNFSSNSYFHLTSTMSDRDISIRLVILNIFALTLSFKSSPRPNWINTILFDTNSTMPINYFEHLQTICLFGLIDNNEIISNMKHVRTSVRQRLNSGHLPVAGKYIYQCSENCLYLYHFTHCGIPNEKSQCLFCKKDIGSTKYGVLIERNPPQIKMTVEQGFQFIDDYIEKFNRENKYGYYQVLSSDQSTIEQKSDHLTSPISSRFLHLFIHSILLILKELNYLSNENLQQWNIQSDLFFQNHAEKDYELLEKCISDSQYCYVWLFQLLNSMLNGFIEPLGMLDSKEKVVQLEKLIEQQLIVPHSASKIEQVNNYKRAYTGYTQKEEFDNTLINFLDERTENNSRYPLLNYFNVTQIFNQNRIEHFYLNLKTMSNAKQNYPLTLYILENIGIWNNIQYLYPIIQFLNYIRDKYNYRIRRQQAVSKSIQECLTELDDKKGEELFKKFSDSWSKINLKEVGYGGQIRTFDRHMNKDQKLAFYSLNASKDDSSLILSATLRTIAKFQNSIVNYYHNEIVKSSTIRHVTIHRIERDDLFCLDADYINSKILKHCLVINFEYGQSKDIIYDYEEMEITLRSLINRLPLLNTNKFRKIQYQFELYSENNSLINDIRYHIAQQSINDDQKRQYRFVLTNKDDNEILQYLGSLDYIFTYIQNRNYRSNISTIELFVNQYIHSKSFLHKNLFLKSTFSSLKLEYIIDLYELIEEIAFDKIFRNYIEEKLNSQSIDNDQQKFIQEKFFYMTIDNKQIAKNLQNIHQWISTLKRFMVRILPDYIDLNIPFEIYLKRTDLWNNQITKDDIETIQLDDSILLKHTFIILIGLEDRLNEQRTIPIPIKTTKTERDEANSFETSHSPKTILLDKPRKKRFRDDS